MSFNAKSNPISKINLLTVFKQSPKLDNGISISWLEQTWNKDILDTNEH